MLGDLKGKIEARKREPAKIEGTVNDQKTGRPLAGALVHTEDAADPDGRPGTVHPPGQAPTRLVVQVLGRCQRLHHPRGHHREARGRSTGDPPRPRGPFRGSNPRPEGRPIAGASLRAWVDRAAVIGHEFDTRNGGANSFILTARTDDQGRFSIPGVPPSKLPVNLEVSHPDHLPVSLEQPAPTSAETRPS